MSKNVFKPHFITVFYLMRSYWYVFAVPFIRFVVEYVFMNKTELIKPLEAVLLFLVLTLSTIKWLSMKIIVDNRVITIENGFLFKSKEKIATSNVCCILNEQSLINGMFNCSVIKIKTYYGGAKNKKRNMALNLQDAQLLCGLIYGGDNCRCIKNVFSVKRFAKELFLIVLGVTAVMLAFNMTIAVTFSLWMFLMLGWAIKVYCGHNYNEVFLGNEIRIGVFGLLYRKAFASNKSKVGFIKITQTPADRRYGTCKVNLSVQNEDGDNVKIGRIDYLNTIKEINKTFSLDISV